MATRAITASEVGVGVAGVGAIGRRRCRAGGSRRARRRARVLEQPALSRRRLHVVRVYLDLVAHSGRFALQL